MPRHIEKRRQGWYAILNVPVDVQPELGRKRFRASLKTRDKRAALRLAKSVIANWQNQIARARNEVGANDDAAILREIFSKTNDKAERLRHALLNAKDDEHRQSIIEQIEYEAWDIGAINVENMGEPPSANPEARKFYKRATGQLVEFTAHLEEWLSTSNATAKTQDMDRSVINRFVSDFPMVQDVTRPDIRRWINKLISEEGLAPKTVQRMLSGLRGYWRYLQSIGVAGEDHEPFSKLDIARQGKRTLPQSARQPFEPEDVVKLLNAAIKRGDEDLADLIRLGMWTGCRIEELCSLKVEQVKDDHFSISDAKTKAGWRDVPIHRKLAQTMARLVEDSKDGYVLSKLKVNKYGNRSNAIGKRFGRLKKDLDFGRQHVFHSIRKTVVTILENAGVPENVVADIVGHEKTTMTYGLYSGGLSLAVKRDALEKLHYSLPG
jgi:integrase